jgi:hypothetical protein
MEAYEGFLTFKGFQSIVGYRDATRHAFQNELIDNGQVWMDMIQSRNETVHTYHNEVLVKGYDNIRFIYYVALSSF